jgi:hypothetical protein
MTNPMGNADNRKTVELDPKRLATLRKAGREGVEADANADEGAEEIAVSRSPTQDDPLTTGVLAEVARQTQTGELDPNEVTGELDPDAVDALVESIDKNARIDTPASHPNVTKRETK